MMKKIDHRNMGRSCLGWLDSWFHFSFAEYYNPKNMHYGVLRVVNDDTIQPQKLKKLEWCEKTVLVGGAGFLPLSKTRRGGNITSASNLDFA